MKNIGLIIKAERLSRGWSLDEAVKLISERYAVGLQKTALFNYENGTRIPRADLLFEILDFYGYTNLDHIAELLVQVKS